MKVHVIRDVLDNQLVDRRGRKMGKADGVVMEVRGDVEPPRLAFIEIGGATLARRLHTRLGKLVARLARRWSVRRGVAVRVPFDKIRKVGIDVKLAVDAEETGALAWEDWIRTRFIERIPWAK